MRVNGHTLIAEGAAFETVLGAEGRPRQVGWNSTAGKGYGQCSCGARSAILDSASQRKAWHRNHKSAVVGR